MTILRHYVKTLTVLCENAKAAVFLLLWDKEVIIPLALTLQWGSPQIWIPSLHCIKKGSIMCLLTRLYYMKESVCLKKKKVSVFLYLPESPRKRGCAKPHSATRGSSFFSIKEVIQFKLKIRDHLLGETTT